MKPSIETTAFHGLEALRLQGPGGSSAVISRLGGQVLSWITPDGRERLFLSGRVVFDGSVPIRGGIPVCFPRFAAFGDLPKHGFVPTREWSVTAQRPSPSPGRCIPACASLRSRRRRSRDSRVTSTGMQPTATGSSARPARKSWSMARSTA